MDSGKVNELLHKYWKMKDPELFISIISGDIKEKKKVQDFCEKFSEKLVEVATQTSRNFNNLTC